MSDPIAKESAFRIDLADRKAQPMKDIALSDVGITERADLQRWVEDFPEIVGPDLLLITTEFDQWEIRDRKVLDRLDVLFLDSDGALLVAELKRDQAPDTTELQALKYAAYCSQLTVPDVIDQHARHHGVESEEAKVAILDHAPALADRELRDVRIRIVACGFGPSVTHVVLWLRDLGLDIGCIELTARAFSNDSAVLSARQLLPPPAAEDYLVSRRRREVEEEEKEASTRRRNSVTVLTEAGAVPVDEVLTLKLDSFNADQRAVVEKQIQANAAFADATWTGLGLRNALKWKLDGSTYSCSGLVWNMLKDLGFDPGAIPGPEYWLLPNGMTLSEFASSLDKTAEAAPDASVAQAPANGGGDLQDQPADGAATGAPPEMASQP